MAELLGYNKIAKKQRFSVLDINESRSKKMWSLSYVTLMIKLFFFFVLDVPTLQLRITEVIN